jgi:hypothetical protein
MALSEEIAGIAREMDMLREINRLRDALNSAALAFKMLADGMEQKGYPDDVVSNLRKVQDIVEKSAVKPA